ncbi:hypothetical protein BD770DRAFT_410603 [Pilaira anomala]|nr:hypothetical protein BD770DRAFT_410603 [Pilaira anomala]
MKVNFNTHGSDLNAAYQAVISESDDTNWLIYAFDKGTYDLRVQETGNGGLEELNDEFSDGKVQFAFAKVIDPNTELPKFVFIGWCGSGVPELRKAFFNSQLSDVSKFFKSYHVQINARDEADVDPTLIMKRVSESSGANYSVHKESAKTQARVTPVNSVYKKTEIPDIAAMQRESMKKENAPKPVGTNYQPVQTAPRKMEQRWNMSQQNDSGANAVRAERERFEKEVRDREIEKAKQVSHTPPPAPARPVQENDRRQQEEAHRRQQQEEEQQRSRQQQQQQQEEAYRRQQEEEAEEEARQLEEQERHRQHDLATAEHKRRQQEAEERERQQQQQEEEERERQQQEARQREQEAHEREQERQRQQEKEQQRQQAQEQEARQRQQEQERQRQQDQELQRQQQKENEERRQQQTLQSQLDQTADRAVHAAVGAAAGATMAGATMAGSKAHQGVCATVLFAYEASEANEMSLSEGELVQQIDQVDEGWWFGVSEDGKKQGLFPANYVQVLEEEEEEGEEVPQQQQQEEAAAATPPPAPPVAPAAPEVETKGNVAVALYDYAAEEDNEISFVEGDTITQIEFVSDDWWQGVDAKGKNVGLFPANYVELKQ